MKSPASSKLLAFAAVVIAGVPFLTAQNGLGKAWRNWAWYRPIDTAPTQRDRLVRTGFPFASYGQAAPEFQDLRIIDEAGTEVAFVLRARSGETTREWRPSRIVEIGYVPGQYTQVEIDTGDNDSLHNSIEIQTGELNFYTLVEVAVSDNREEWRIARDKAPFYRFQSDGLQGTQTVTYPETHARWLRLRISGHPAQFPLSECRTAFTLTEPAELEDIGAAAAPVLASPSVWEIEFEQAMPLAGVRFTTSAGEFHRPVVVKAGASRDELDPVAEGELYRYRSESDPEQTRSRLSFTFAERRARFWRIEVRNRGDQPLPDLDLYPLYIPRWLVFRQEPGRSYRLLYGNARASASAYDLAIVTPREELDGASIVTAGGERRNSDYLSPEPWTERHPLLLWAALGLAVVVLIWLAFRSLKPAVAGTGDNGENGASSLRPKNLPPEKAD